jgi:hypothetical protein
MAYGEINKLYEFIFEERKKYSGNDDNRFAFSFGQAFRYYEYLLLIADRYDKFSLNLTSNIGQLQAEWGAKGGKVSPNVIRLIEEQCVLSTRVNLEIESFYIFAKILLDKLAQFLQDYFGNVRACPLASHKKLTNNYIRFASAKRIEYPAEFTTILAQLQEHISEYRNKQITHFKNPRSFKGTVFWENGETGIQTDYLYPNERELSRQVTRSKPISDLLQLMEQYLQKVIETVQQNREKTRFALKEERLVTP